MRFALDLAHCLPAAAFAAALLSACGGADESRPSTAPAEPSAHLTYHRDVQPLVEAKCTGCHQEGGIAPFALTSYSAFVQAGAAVRNAVATKIMPPWLAGAGCTEYLDDQSLSDEQIATITDWIDAGAPEGDPSDAPNAAPKDGEGLSRVDLNVAMPMKYTPQQEPDDYRCFLLDWPEQETSFVTGFRANPGNPQIVHHVIAYLVPPAEAATFQALDDAEAGPGYTCFGGPGGSVANVAWIGAWAPGSAGGDYPAGTGLKVLPGSKIALQVHYNTLNGLGDDQTSFDVSLESAVDKEAKLQFWTNPSWVFGNGMDIPAGDANVEHDYAADPTPFAMGGKPFVMHSAFMHMHTRGKTGRLELLREGGDKQCLLDIADWNFHWQLSYFFSQPKLVQPGDQISIRCTWDNSAENQPFVDGKQVAPIDLAWGEGTTDEMCLGGFYISEP